MPRKKKPDKPDNSKKIAELKKRWFKLALIEKLGKTKWITKQLDQIEKEIKELQ